MDIKQTESYYMDNNCIKGKTKSTNRGASLLMVIIAMTFVGVIAAVVIALTYRNLESIRTGMASTANFYTAEVAMDELKTTMNEWADKAVRVSYTQWLQQLGTTERSKQEQKFKQLFVAEMVKVLNEDFMKYFGDSPAEDIDSLFDTFDADVKWNETAGDPLIITSDVFEPHTVTTEDDTQLTIKNISVVYKDSRGFSTTITTDYVFDIHYPGLAVNAVTETNVACADYVIIADGQIQNVANATLNVRGSIYGGGYNKNTLGYDIPGMLLNGGNTVVFADNVLSKSDIEVTNGAKLTVKGIDADEDYTGELHYGNIWARGLNVSGEGPAGMNLQGNCYITDDTTMNAKTDGSNGNSFFNVVGSYYGYNTNNAVVGNKDEQGISLTYGTPEGSSSVVINSENTNVDFTQCNPLWLAGKSFVSVPDQYGYIDKNNVSFVEGDSVSYRGLQSAYLMPGDCIIGIGHNPMTDTEYESLVEGNSKKSEDRTEEDCYIDLTRSYSNGGVRLTNYVNLTEPYRVAYVTYSASSAGKLVYLYLNFSDTDKAAEYFQEYEGKFGTLVNQRMASLGSGRVLFNPATIVSTGNCIGYEDVAGGAGVSLYPANRDYNDSDVENMQTELATKYVGLTSGLDEAYSGVSSEYLTDSIVDMSKVNDNRVDVDLGSLEGIYEQAYLITGSDIEITSNMTGIIIAKGDVSIAGGIDFKGLIIARGNVIVNGTYTAAPDSVSYLILNHEKVMPFFKLQTEEGYGTGDVQATDIISIDYENWKKN